MSTESMLNYCIQKAREGDSSGRVRVYSVATDKRGNFLGESLNSYIKTSPIMKRWANKMGHIGKEYLHSEMRTILSAMKSGKTISKLYIARVNKKGESLPALPCDICKMFIEDYERLFDTKVEIICQWQDQITHTCTSR